MRNKNLIPYETIVRATNGEPEAVNAVLKHYDRNIKYHSLVGGQVHPDTEESIKETLIASLFKYRFE